MASSLKPWERVLFLSHTNAARDEITSRLKAMRHYVVARTLDAFAIEVLAPYATLWGLPDPLRPPRQPDQPATDWFADVRNKAAKLLAKTPALARAVVCRYPFILADEHQDAASDQHALVMALAEAGSRVRFFGDGLQGIMLFAADVPGWDALVGSLPAASLTGAQRWRGNPGFGAWITAARADLIAGRPVDLRAAPDCVEIVRHRGAGAEESPLRRYLLDVVGDDDVVVLVRSNADAVGMARDDQLGLDLVEGSNLTAVDRFLNDVIEGEDDPRALLEAIIRLLSGTGRWVEAGANRLRAALDATLTTSAAGQAREGGSGTELLVQRVARTLSDEPRFAGALRALRRILRQPMALGWSQHSPNALGVLGSLPEAPFSEKIYDAAYAAQQAMASSPAPRRCVSTIHKAKGREFPHAVIASAGRDTFRSSRNDRNLLYVAISRPIERLTLIVPGVPSPLIRVP